MKQTILLMIVVLLFFGVSYGQQVFSEENFRVFDASGKAVTFEDLLVSASASDVVFFGESHNDAVAHSIQAEAFRRLLDKYGDKRKVVVSLEMFERDVQVVLDEYLAGLISEQHFLSSSRPWGNYKTDYRPLVELAKEKKLKVIAANAPRRYVNMVTRGGRKSLESLSAEARKWLPPIPYNQPSEAYSKKFRDLMGSSSEASMGLDNILSSQTLWDASMSYWIAEKLKANKGSLVVHLNGSFHTEKRLGTVEHLMIYRPNTKAVVVTMRPEEDFKNFDTAKHKDLGDFVILTDAKQPRSQR